MPAPGRREGAGGSGREDSGRLQPGAFRDPPYSALRAPGHRRCLPGPSRPQHRGARLRRRAPSPYPRDTPTPPAVSPVPPIPRLVPQGKADVPQDVVERDVAGAVGLPRLLEAVRQADAPAGRRHAAAPAPPPRTAAPADPAPPPPPPSPSPPPPPAPRAPSSPRAPPRPAPPAPAPAPPGHGAPRTAERVRKPGPAPPPARPAIPRVPGRALPSGARALPSVAERGPSVAERGPSVAERVPSAARGLPSGARALPRGARTLPSGCRALPERCRAGPEPRRSRSGEPLNGGGEAGPGVVRDGERGLYLCEWGRGGLGRGLRGSVSLAPLVSVYVCVFAVGASPEDTEVGGVRAAPHPPQYVLAPPASVWG